MMLLRKEKVLVTDPLRRWRERYQMRWKETTAVDSGMELEGDA